MDLENSLKDAMRAGEDLRKRTLRLALSAIRMLEIDKGKPAEEASVIAILQKEVKSRRETIEEARQAGRQDIVDPTEAEIEVLNQFLPQPFSPAELQALAREAVAEVGASTPADMGKVMKVLMPRVQGKATGDQVSQIVRQLLA